MKCDKQCSYRTPYGYCSLTKCQVNLGTPIDIKKYCIPKEEYNIPTVNEGIQEGRKLVFCKDCKYWLKQGHEYPNVCIRGDMEIAYDESAPLEMDANDFCSRGEQKDG